MASFLKMHGLGNDFVVFDRRKNAFSLTPARARAIADRRHGVGCDQVIVIGAAANGIDATMRIYNADGGEVESCGNAARCVARLLMDENGTSKVMLDTAGGPLSCTRAGELVTIDMGIPRFEWRQIPLSEPRDTLCFGMEADREFPALKEVSAANIGNPHCILFVPDAEQAPVERVGPLIEKDPLFPKGTNVEFVQVLSSDRLRMRVWERGVGVTLACGTGACAAMAAAQRRQLCGTKMDVQLDGGTLIVEWQGEGSHIFMTGPASLSFRGDVDIGALR